MSNMHNLENHKSIQKDGAVKTNVSVLTQVKVFDMQWSSTVKEQNKTLARTLTMGPQRGCTAK